MAFRAPHSRTADSKCLASHVDVTGRVRSPPRRTPTHGIGPISSPMTASVGLLAVVHHLRSEQRSAGFHYTTLNIHPLPLTEEDCLCPRPPLAPPPPPPRRLGPLASRMPESSSIRPARRNVLPATEFLPRPLRPFPEPPALLPCALASAEKGLPDMMPQLCMHLSRR